MYIYILLVILLQYEHFGMFTSCFVQVFVLCIHDACMLHFCRLGLERGKTADECLSIMTNLLEKHGQGGACSEDGYMTYHNSFIIADRSGAWILETLGKHWAAECVKCTSIYIYIS